MNGQRGQRRKLGRSMRLSHFSPGNRDRMPATSIASIARDLAILGCGASHGPVMAGPVTARRRCRCRLPEVIATQSRRLGREPVF